MPLTLADLTLRRSAVNSERVNYPLGVLQSALDSACLLAGYDF